MKINTLTLTHHIESRMAENSDLSVRCSYLLQTLLERVEDQTEVEAYDLFLILIFLSDGIPAKCIVELLTLVTDENSFDVLERDTVQRSAEFLRDYLKNSFSKQLAQNRKRQSMDNSLESRIGQSSDTTKVTMRCFF